MSSTQQDFTPYLAAAATAGAAGLLGNKAGLIGTQTIERLVLRRVSLVAGPATIQNRRWTPNRTLATNLILAAHWRPSDPRLKRTPI